MTRPSPGRDLTYRRVNSVRTSEATSEMQMLEEILEGVARDYPSELIDDQLRDVPRIAFNIRLAVNGADPKALSICDIGGGVGLFSTGCAALGMKALLVDDFADPINRRVGDSVFVVHKKYGVRILSRNVITDGLADISERFDVVTTFDSMEHWHHSPKRLFRQIGDRLLKPERTLCPRRAQLRQPTQALERASRRW